MKSVSFCAHKDFLSIPDRSDTGAGKADDPGMLRSVTPVSQAVYGIRTHLSAR